MFAMYEKINDEISRLIDGKVISPVKSSEWATPIVPVIKPSGQLGFLEITKLYSTSLSKLIGIQFHGLTIYYRKLKKAQFFTSQNCLLQSQLTEVFMYTIDCVLGLLRHQDYPKD